jgi:CDP-6-deoxy-D-xylo-4-hexulose-3-dehydrase
MKKHPLMTNNISRKDLDKVIKHLKKKDPMLTQHNNVRLFEKKWSNWLGVKYSVFVNSGSSANYISLRILSETTKKKRNNSIAFKLGFGHFLYFVSWF